MSKKVFLSLFVTIFLLLSSIQSVTAAGKGFWSTKEGKIVDKDGKVVRIAGVNWGFNPYNAKLYGQFFGSTKANYQEIMNTIKTYGFNTIRLTWTYRQTDQNCKFDNAGKKNNELVGLSCLQALDKIIEYAGQLNLRIILDHHSPNRRGFTSSEWLPAWQKLAQRYKGNETIIGADLDNEPATCWGCGSPNDWKSAAARAGNAILAINPNWLIIVEDLPGTNNLVNTVQTSPLKINASNKLVYSTHVYGWTITSSEEWDVAWGNLVKQKIAPVLVGEFNLHFVNSGQLEWFDSLTNYMKSNEIGGTGWAWLYDDPKFSGESWYVQSLINPDYLTLQNDNRQKSFNKWYVQLDPIVNKPTPAVTRHPSQTPTKKPTTSPTPTKEPSLTVSPTPTKTLTSTPTNKPSITSTPTPTIKFPPGDGNKDGRVDGLDYLIWLNHYGTTTTRGSEDGDYNTPPNGKIDGIDYVIWLNNLKW